MSKCRKKIGLLGGSFDPIHLGHLHLAKELSEVVGLDEVWFIPAKINPLKQHTQPVDLTHRLSMVEAAIRGYPNYKMVDIECSRDGPSYTVDTLRVLTKQHSNDDFYLLVGSDNMNDFNKWKNPEEIRALVTIVIGVRAGFESDNTEFYQIPKLDVSSTEIRERLNKGEECSAFLPKEISQYIKKNGLYQ